MTRKTSTFVQKNKVAKPIERITDTKTLEKIAFGKSDGKGKTKEEKRIEETKN